MGFPGGQELRGVIVCSWRTRQPSAKHEAKCTLGQTAMRYIVGRVAAVSLLTGLCARGQELQDVNRKQLAVIRQLSAEHEAERDAVRAGVEAHAREAAERLQSELDELKAQRERQEVPH